MSTLMYEVRPLVKPVRTPEGRTTRAPFSAMLTIEQVKEYMKVASIYRKFPDYATPIKVTGNTLEDLHRNRFYKGIIDSDLCKKEIPNGPGPDYVPTEDVDEEVCSCEEEVEEVIAPCCEEEVDDSYEEEIVEEPISPSEEDVAEEILEEAEEDVKEEVVKTETPVNNTTPASRNIQFNSSSNNNKKNKQNYHNHNKK